MSYERAQRLLHNGGTLILDGGTGTELERRGVTMNPEAWCGMASLESVGILEEIHKDYISAGADIITANTYCSSRLLLKPAGYGNQFEEINYAAIDAAQRARDASGREEVLIAGSLSHRGAITSGTAKPDLAQAPSDGEMADAFGELAALLHARGCDLILLEMMYDPERMVHAFLSGLGSRHVAVTMVKFSVLLRIGIFSSMTLYRYCEITTSRLPGLCIRRRTLWGTRWQF